MEIHWVHANELDEEQRRSIEERARTLAAQKGDLMDLRILVRSSNHHQHGGDEVRITCDARGKEIVVVRSAADAGLALNEAMDVFEREVRRMRERRAVRRADRGESPPEASSA